MIIAYVIFFALGVGAFFLMEKFGVPVRIAVALVVFIVPSIVATVWIVRVGDKPPPDAITIVPKPSDNTDSKAGPACPERWPGMAWHGMAVRHAAESVNGAESPAVG